MAVTLLLTLSLALISQTEGIILGDIMATMCGNSTLEDRLMSNIKYNDQDRNMVVTGPEIFDDLTNNYDVNQDGCVDKKEWMYRWLNFYHFSPEMAEAVWPGTGDDTSSCQVSIIDYKTNPMRVPTDAWVGTLLDILISQVCSKNTQGINCDCLDLKPTCQNSKTLSSNPSCVTFLACDGKGSLSDRLVKNIKVNDADDNKLVTGPEFFEDLKKNYDVDQDGCISLKEWVDRWLSYFKFSKEYAEGRFPGNASAPCPVDYSSYEKSTLQIPVPNFISDNIQTLIDVCNSNSTYMVTNCDCAQLADTCKNDDYFSTIEACIKYAATLP